MKKGKFKRNRGDIVKIDLGDGKLAFAQVLKEPLFVFFDLISSEVPQIERITSAPILFEIWVMNRAVTEGIWPIVGKAPIGTIDEAPRFFKRDQINGKLTITFTGAEEQKATLAECIGLECAAVWDPEHVVDRLRDHYAGRPNKWTESMRPR